MLLITPQERAALQLLANGKGTNEIAGPLGLSDDEVDAHLTTLFTRMGATNQAEGIAAAFRRGLLTAEDLMTDSAECIHTKLRSRTGDWRRERDSVSRRSTGLA